MSLYQPKYEEIICLFNGALIEARKNDDKDYEEKIIQSFIDFSYDIAELYHNRKLDEMKHLPKYYHYINK